MHETISRETITKELHISEGHISHLFKKETGVPLTEYITDMRIEKAKKLLTNSNDSIAEICEKIGYNYQAYFTKIFKEKTGMSPIQYRKTVRINRDWQTGRSNIDLPVVFTLLEAFSISAPLNLHCYPAKI